MNSGDGFDVAQGFENLEPQRIGSFVKSLMNRTFFHSVVAALVLTISATSAHADLSKGCELQGDYGVLLKDVAGLSRKSSGMNSDKLAYRMSQLAQKASDYYKKCIQTASPETPKDLAESDCLNAEAQAINDVIALEKKPVTEGSNKTCFNNDVSTRFEEVIKISRVKRVQVDTHEGRSGGGYDKPGSKADKDNNKN